MQQQRCFVDRRRVSITKKKLLRQTKGGLPSKSLPIPQTMEDNPAGVWFCRLAFSSVNFAPRFISVVVRPPVCAMCAGWASEAHGFGAWAVR
jgi:hypothetical protein